MSSAPCRISQCTRRLGGLLSSARMPKPTHNTRRTFATETSLPNQKLTQSIQITPSTTTASPVLTNNVIPAHLVPPTVLTTLYSFPSFEPTRFLSYPSSYLYLPIRKDILHRAVVYEGDKTRQGTAHTKWRSEVHGSNRKIRPQKGSGRARLGDKKSPMLRGGGRAFGPKFRDFSTDLPRKVYDLAWRTALSYRYKRGQLIIVEGQAEIEDSHPSLVREIFAWNKWGKEDGRSLVVTNEKRERLFDALDVAGEQGKALQKEDVDVKDLLKMGRVIVERSALEWIFAEHQRDLIKSTRPLLDDTYDDETLDY